VAHLSQPGAVRLPPTDKALHTRWPISGDAVLFGGRPNEGSAQLLRGFHVADAADGHDRQRQSGAGAVVTATLRSECATTIPPKGRNISAAHRPTALTKYLEREAKQQTARSTADEHFGVQLRADKENIPQTAKPKKQLAAHTSKGVFGSMVERVQLRRPQTSVGVGPGSYNVAEAFGAIHRTSEYFRVAPKGLQRETEATERER
jgi:hypothetical protein